MLVTSHVRSVVERALDKHEPDPPVCIVVHGDPTKVPDLGPIDGRPTRVLGSRSPLAIRAALADVDGEVLVVVTDLDAGTLGDDLLARVVNRSVHVTDRWRTVSQLFGAEQPSVALARHAALADALIAHRPANGYPKVTAKILDVDTAVDALLRAAVDLPPEATFAQLLDTSAQPRFASFLHDAAGDLVDDVTAHLADRFGGAARGVVALVRAGHGPDLVAWGLAAATVHAPGATGAEAARALLERDAGRPGLTSDDWRRLGAAAEDRHRAEYDPGVQSAWRHRAAEVLADLDATDLARWSDIIPAGFDQRLAEAGAALQAWIDAPTDATADAAHAAIAACKRHVDRTERAGDIDVADMAARLLRRGDATIAATGGLAEVARAYRDDGAWVDRARVVVSRLGTDPAVAQVCRVLTSRFDTARAEQAPALAAALAKAAGPLPDDLCGVEDVLDVVVAPLAEVAPVLLVVLDGMSLATFWEFAGELTAANWTAVASGPRTHSPAVAALPTVTEVSRTSLLAGTLRRGDGDSEKRAFAGHAGLGQVSAAHHPPLLFHKRDLRVGGLDAPPEDALNAIRDTRRRVVGVVINNIDERLKDVVAPPAGWTLSDLSPLRDLLAEAKRAGRAVVLTADHGHVIDRDAEQRPAGGGGERWRPAAGAEPAADEIVVRGPRVVADEGTAIVPTVEQVRYATRRNGYHGGLTVQEVLVPLVVLTADDVDGWAPVPLAPPPWWDHRPATATVAPAPAAKPTPPPSDRPTLFDLDEPAGEPSTEAAIDTTAPGRPEIVARLLASDLYAERLTNPRVRLDAATVATVLDRLGTGVAVPEEQIAALTGLAAARAGRFVSQLQELLNVDGYAIVRADGGEVRVDLDLLRTQFDL